MRNFLFLFALFCLLCSGCSTTGRLFDQAARGDVRAQRELGLANFYGDSRVGAVDFDQAFRYFQSAAAQGDATSMYYLGEIYERGLGKIPVDGEKAESFYQAALPKVVAGESSLRGLDAMVAGLMYRYGRGVSPDPVRAAAFFNEAIRRGNYESMFLLGDLYLGADNAPLKQNLPKAIQLLESAVKHGFPEAQYLYSIYLEPIAPDRSAALLEAAVKSGYPAAVFRSAEKSGNKNLLSLAARKTVEQGYAPAFYQMAQEEENPQRKLELLQQSAWRGHYPAMEALSLLAESNKDWPRAIIYALMYNRYAPRQLSMNSTLLRLDQLTGLLLPLELLWENHSAPDLMRLDSRLPFFIRGYQSGITNTRENFVEYLADYSRNSLESADFLPIYQAKVPMTYAGDIFRIARKRLELVTPAFYLNYALAAGLAGQGEAQFAGASAIQEGSDKAGKLARAKLLLQANGYALMNQADRGYELLFANYDPKLPAETTEFTVNFLNGWCAALLRDGEKLSAATGIPRDRFVSPLEIVRQDFYDLADDCDISRLEKLSEPVLDETAE